MPAIAGKDADRRLCQNTHVVAAPPQAVTMTTAPTMATTKSGALRLPQSRSRWHHADSEATVGDIFQGDIASTRQANAQDIRVACIAVVQPRV